MAAISPLWREDSHDKRLSRFQIGLAPADLSYSPSSGTDEPGRHIRDLKTGLGNRRCRSWCSSLRPGGGRHGHRGALSLCCRHDHPRPGQRDLWLFRPLSISCGGIPHPGRLEGRVLLGHRAPRSGKACQKAHGRSGQHSSIRHRIAGALLRPYSRTSGSGFYRPHHRSHRSGNHQPAFGRGIAHFSHPADPHAQARFLAGHNSRGEAERAAGTSQLPGAGYYSGNEGDPVFRLQQTKNRGAI